MQVLKTVIGLRTALSEQGKERTIGLVPTMGALHLGHASLIKQAKSENDLVVVSIFVNPLQFAPEEDLQNYPRQLEQDYQLCLDLGVNLVFAPNAAEMGIHSTERQTQVIPAENLTSSLCGVFRRGHFTGVATIVTKLLNIVSPNVAYFGEKDFQQLVIIRRLVEELKLPVLIKACPTIREESGLAVSSRNSYLSEQDKKEAAILYKALSAAKQSFESGERNAYSLLEIAKKVLQAAPNLKVEYIEFVHTQTLAPLKTVQDRGLLAVAAYLGSTRLIDNIQLNARKPIIAIDGPAGAGKSTVTRRVAQELGLLYLDSGAMYRAVTWLVIKSAISPTDQVAIAELVSQVQIELMPTDSLYYSTEVYVNGQRVTEEIRSPEVTSLVSTIAAIASVRTVLVALQKAYGEQGGVIAEGRDIGTDVFPDAELKIFLTASVAQRVKRRQKDLQNQGNLNVDLEKLAQDIQQRDYLDSNRSISPLRQAPDALKLITDELSLEQVCQKIVNLYRERHQLSHIQQVI